MTVDLEKKTFEQVRGLYQWDCGQVLEVTGLPFSGSFEAHTEYQKLGLALVEYCETADGSALIPIPDVVLQQEIAHFDVWIYKTSESAGKTVITIRCFVAPRSRPADVEEITDIDISKLRAIPVASIDRIGGITAEPKTDAQTMPVGIDPETGRLYTESGGVGHISATASVDDTSGTPNVEVENNNGSLDFKFSGLKGETGPQGPRGEKGDPGETGSQGEPGQDGAAATITVGSVTTGEPGTNAQVTNSGTTVNAVLDFVIPRGEDGSDNSETSSKNYEKLYSYETEMGDVLSVEQDTGLTDFEKFKHIFLLVEIETSGQTSSINLNVFGSQILYVTSTNVTTAYPKCSIKADFWPLNIDGNQNTAFVKTVTSKLGAAFMGFTTDAPDINVNRQGIFTNSFTNSNFKIGFPSGSENITSFSIEIYGQKE